MQDEIDRQHEQGAPAPRYKGANKAHRKDNCRKQALCPFSLAQLIPHQKAKAECNRQYTKRVVVYHVAESVLQNQPGVYSVNVRCRDDQCQNSKAAYQIGQLSCLFAEGDGIKGYAGHKKSEKYENNTRARVQKQRTDAAQNIDHEQELCAQADSIEIQQNEKRRQNKSRYQ